jgi:NADPH-dependent curcumin reductase CurA
MIMCGMIAGYNDVAPRPGPSLVATARKRLKIQGLISPIMQRCAPST